MMRSAQVIIGGILVALFCACFANAQETTIWKIEEDWEMVINDPDPATFSPQVTFFTSPSVSSDDTYFQLQMNYAADEGFSGGGFHVAAVFGEDLIDEARSATSSTLATDGDVIRWTSVMATINGKYLFAVKDGHGDEWGHFGGPAYLVQLSAGDAVDLSSYHHQQSLDSVDVGFGGNRVHRITLERVRLHYADGHVTTLHVNAQP